LDAVAEPLRDSLRLFADVEDLSGYALVLDGLAAEAYLLGDLPRSARLIGAVQAIQQSSGTGLAVANRELIGFTHEPVIERPDLAPFVAEGERLSSADAVAYGLLAASGEPAAAD
ncbi:MAG TPA: hypothetical protein VFM74_00090, partial [Candidatus Limnocylindria bacterium]|nr:hypothetical protein [Candidatus Limnocylindria bacterium]